MKKIAKTLIGLSFISILFSGCEAEKEMTKQGKLIVKPFSMKETAAKTKTGLSKAINDVRLMKIKNANSSNAKIVFDEKSGLYFDDQKGLYIEKDGLKSYTFPVLKTTSDAKLKNICFNEKQNGNYDVYLVKYDLTKAESLTLTEQQKQAREKQFIPLIKNGVPLEELKMQCIDIYLSTTTEYVVPVDQGELTGNTGTTTVSHTTSVLIGSSCTMQGLSGGNQYGGNASGTSSGNGLGNGDNNQTSDSDIITGLNTRDLEGVLGDEELFYYNYTAFTSGLNTEQNAAFNAHPELMEYFMANGWSNENQGLVRDLIDKFQGNDYNQEQKETLSQLVSVCAAQHVTLDYSTNGSSVNFDTIDQLNSYIQSVKTQEIIEETGSSNPINQNQVFATKTIDLTPLIKLAIEVVFNPAPDFSLVSSGCNSFISNVVVGSSWTQNSMSVTNQNFTASTAEITLVGYITFGIKIKELEFGVKARRKIKFHINTTTGVICCTSVENL